MAWRGSVTTIATIMSPRVLELRRPRFRWMVPGAIVILAPKCVLCLAAYLGIGSTLGWTGAEICSAQNTGPMHNVAWLVVGAVALGVGALVVHAGAICLERRRKKVVSR